MKPAVYLKPGGYFFGQLEGDLITLLGSCVSLCAWHPEKKLLLASHVVLPVRPSDSLLKDTRYGDVVMQCFLADAYRHRTQISDYRLALFGGSSTIYAENYQQSVGSRNVSYMKHVVTHVMQQQLLNENVGGHQHRRLEIDGKQGRFKVSLLNSSASVNETNQDE